MAEGGDEGGGPLWAGSLCGTDRGPEPTGSGAAVWDRPADSSQDAGVLGSTGVPAEATTGASEARPIHRDHRAYPEEDGPAEEAAAYLEADLRAALRRAWLCRRDQHC